MPGEVELRVGSVPGVGHAEVNLVWDPPWDPGKMTDEAALKAVDAEIRKIVNDSAEFAQHSPEPDPSELWTDILVGA